MYESVRAHLKQLNNSDELLLVYFLRDIAQNAGDCWRYTGLVMGNLCSTHPISEFAVPGTGLSTTINDLISHYYRDIGQ